MPFYIDHEERLPLYVKSGEWDPELPYGPLLRYTPFIERSDIELTSTSALDTSDEFTQLKASQILTLILSSKSPSLPPEVLSPFLNTLASLVQATGGNNSNKRDVAVQCLESLLTRPEARIPIWEKPGIIAG